MRENFLPLTKPNIADSEIEAVRGVLESGHLTTGPKVAEFEKAICDYIGEGFCAVGLSSCTAGLHLALLAHGIGEGDEVIVPTWTFVATSHVVFWTGAKPVLCDVDEASLNIDIHKMQDLINPRTKAIIPVHFAGYPCDMDEVMDVAKKHRLWVIEDAAHAIGTKYKGKKIGNLGNITVFSFYAIKNLSCGEGGMAVSKNEKIIEKIRNLSYFGIDKEAHNRYKKKGTWYYEIKGLGYKYNMDDIHAAIGLVQLKKLDQMNERRRYIASLYRKNLDSRIKFIKDSRDSYHIYHLFPIRIDRRIMNRNDFVNKLKERNIGTGVHFIPLHKHPFYRGIMGGAHFPVANKAYEEIVSIPVFPGMSDEDVYYVIENINDILRKGG